MKEILRVNNLSFGYDDNQVLKNLNLTINEGDFVAIIGENGSGKTTLFKLIINELIPQEGEIYLFGTNVNQLKDWTKVGYVAQTPMQYSDFPATVKEIVRANLYSKMGIFQFYNKEHTELTIQALKKVNMQDNLNRQFSKLSRGQQQRVMIARVMINQPKIMFLDEPTAGVDVNAIDGIYHLLKQLNEQEKVTICIITHDVAKIGQFASRVICIENKDAYELSKEEIQNEIYYRHRHNVRTLQKGRTE